MVNSQFFRAPEIPQPKVKIGRRNIKSAVITGAGSVQPQLQLRKSTFSFIKPVTNLLQPEQLTTSTIEKQSIIQKIVEPIINNKIREKIVEIIQNRNILQRPDDNKPQGIEEALEETNRILVEIQKQLALDFATRIAEDKRTVKSEKLRISKDRVALKEKVIEGAQKLGAGIGKVFDKVTAPARSIFQKILDFFSTIVTGILVNNAFKWLEKEENRQKIYKFITFLGDHWKEILIVVGTAKLLGLLLKIVKVAKIFKGLLNLIKKNPPKPPGPGGGNPCAPLLQCMGNPAFSAAFVAASIGALIANQALSSHIRDVAQGLIPAVPTTSPVPGVPTPPPILGPAGRPIVFPSNSTNEPVFTPEEIKTPAPSTSSLTTEQIWQIAKANLTDPIILATIGAGVAAAMLDSPVPGPADLASVAATSGGLLARFRALSSLGRLRGVPAGVRLSRGGTVPNLSALNVTSVLQLPQEKSLLHSGPKKKCDTCSLLPFFSSGGTVGGTGPGTVDSVPAMLAPGEEVTKASEAMRWRPLLKDINDNGARMWQSFTNAIVRQENTNTAQAENNLQLSEILNDYQKVLKSEEQRLKQKYIESVAKTSPGSNPRVPKLPPSAAQPGTGPKGNQVGSPPPASPSSEVGMQPSSAGQFTPSGTSKPAAPKPTAQGTSTESTGGKVTPLEVVPYSEPAPTVQPTPAATPQVEEPVDDRVKERYSQGNVPAITPEQKNLPLSDPRSPFHNFYNFREKQQSNEQVQPEKTISKLLTISPKLELKNLKKEKPKPIIASLPAQVNYVPMNGSTGKLSLPDAPSAYVPDISPINPLYEEQIIANMINLGTLMV